ncbi:trypsin-like peptidase domain-containing protein [Ilumatobacter nonamiensis]|uniref:trypsin-like peptidase domain-containing protein n=1 Tax=Ilumatobacter nonamiensis TaxID=467093 RepID=UPI000349D3EF|nr:trypsin-like peptidase domain-containing protein [Ilumatobacter nonamiensis]
MNQSVAGWMTLAVLSITAGCSGSDDASPADDRTVAAESALDVRANGCGPREGFGTAALVSDDRAVTAAHVVAGADDVRVIDQTGTEHPADVVFFDPDLDVAVLAVPDDLGTPLDVSSEAPDAGAAGVVGFSRLEDGTVRVRVVDVEVLRNVNIATTDIYLDADVDRPGFEVDAEIDPGDSGGVVVIDGKAAGIIWARSNANEGRAWAIDIPDAIGDRAQLATLTDPVDTGSCIR